MFHTGQSAESKKVNIIETLSLTTCVCSISPKKRVTAGFKTKNRTWL